MKIVKMRIEVMMRLINRLKTNIKNKYRGENEDK